MKPTSFPEHIVENRLRWTLQAQAGLAMPPLARQQRPRRLRHLLQAAQVRADKTGLQGPGDLGSPEQPGWPSDLLGLFEMFMRNMTFLSPTPN